MPLVTLEHKSRFDIQNIKSPVIKELLKEIYNLGEDRWLVAEHPNYKKRFLRKTLNTYSYEVMWSIQDNEQQLINMPIDGYIVEESVAAAFLMGIRIGLE